MSSRSFYDQILAATGKGTPNYSLYAVPAMYAIAFLPHLLVVAVLSGGKWENSNPRCYVARIDRKEKKTATEQMILRAEACQANSFENLGWFAAAIVAANVAKLPAEQINALAGSYLVTRFAYMLLYVGVSNELLSYLRSGAYFAGVAINFTLFIRAGRALQ